jgi:ankyrin repeat protein
MRFVVALAVFTLLTVFPVMAQYEDQLFTAAARDDAAEVKNLLESGQPIEARDAAGRTALLIATRANAIAAAHLLIRRGADVNAKDDMADTPFLYAGAEGRFDILKRILTAASPNLRDTNRFGGTALIPAAEKGHLDNVRLLLEAGVDPNHINRLGWTALLEAVILSDGGPVHQQIVAALIAGGADVDIADGDGVTPLAHARRRGYDEIAKLLEDAGAR